MRTIAKYELKMGENRITLPINNHVLVAESDGEKMWLIVEIETETREFNDVPFLVTGVGYIIDERAMLNVIGSGKIEEEMVVVWEIL